MTTAAEHAVASSRVAEAGLAIATAGDAAGIETTEIKQRGGRATGCPELALLLDRLTAERYRPVPPPPGRAVDRHRPQALPAHIPADATMHIAGGEGDG